MFEIKSELKACCSCVIWESVILFDFFFNLRKTSTFFKKSILLIKIALHSILKLQYLKVLEIQLHFYFQKQISNPFHNP